MTEANDQYLSKWMMKWFLWLLIVGIMVNVSGLFVTILEPDGALYASISKTIAQSNDLINLKVQGKDWLDKPHFPFWITALSFKLFGINTASYKLPALLFWAIGGLYTYFLAKALYSKNIAMLSVLIYVTAAHLVISNNDVRAEPYLTGLIIGSVYHFHKASQKTISLSLVMGSLLAALAVMTKGPFILIIIASGFAVDLLLKKQWKQLLHYRWLVAAFFILLFILPDIYCLYQQFDLHPEKIIFGRTGVSGVHFFFCESQFGRFFNNGPIRGKGDLLFFTHTILWAFLPWSLLLYAGVFSRIQNKNGNASATEGITIGISLVTFLLFSLSKFQLPHYMNIVFPFFSILTAQYLYGLHSKNPIRTWSWIQHVISLLLVVTLLSIVIYYKSVSGYFTIITISALYVIILYFFGENTIGGVVGRSVTTSALLYAFLNMTFYPDLLNYQSGSKAACFINKNSPGKIVCTYLENSYSFAFYIHQPVEYYTSLQSIKSRLTQQELLVFTSEDNLQDLVSEGLSIHVMAIFPHFHISQLTGEFLNYKTRKSVTKNMIVARLSKSN